MTWTSFISNIFCKKRKSSKPSQASNRAKKNSSKNPTSFKDDNRKISRQPQPAQHGSNDELDDSIVAQKIEQSDDEDSHSETERSQQSLHLNGKISAALPSTVKKAERVTLSRGNKHEKVDLYQPRRINSGSQVDNFVQGEGSQPRIRTRPNNQDSQRENQEERGQGRAGQQQIARQANNRIQSEAGTTNVPMRNLRNQNIAEENESLFSSELSSQSENGRKEERKEKALKNLENFYLQGIRVTKDGAWDKRYDEKRIIKFVDLCRLADMNPFFYCKTNFQGKIEGEALAERTRSLLEKDGINITGLEFTSKGVPKIARANNDAKKWLDKYGYPVLS